MTREELKQLGLEKEQIDSILIMYSKDVEPIQQERETLQKQYQELKETHDTMSEQVKQLEGVDVEELKNQVTKLNSEIEETKKGYEDKLKYIEFESKLNSKISDMRGRNPKAIMALLDTESLRSSVNLDSDIDNALKNIAENDPYMFEKENEDAPKIKLTTGAEHSDGLGVDSKVEVNDFIRAVATGQTRG